MEIKRQLKPPPQPPEPDDQGPLDYIPVSGSPLQHPHQPRLHKAIFAIVAAIIILLLAGGAGAYWFLVKQRAPSKTATNSNTQQTNSGALAPVDTTPTSTLAQYVSNGKDLNLTFMYPSNWTVEPTSNNNTNDNPITVTSTSMSMVDVNGKAVTGKVVIGIYPGGKLLPELASDKATSAAASEQFAYTKPTTAQHQYPYLTFIHLSGGTNTSGAFEEVVVTGITSFTKDQSILPESLTMIDPLITARFYQCVTQDCNTADATPLSINMSTWQSSDAFSPVQAVLASMQLN